MSALLRSELFRLSRRKLPWILLGILAIVLVGLYLLLWSALETQEGQAGADDLRDLLEVSSVPSDGMSLAYTVAGVMAVILAGSIIATEFSWGTVRTLLPRTAGRDAFIAAKLVTVTLFVALLIVFSYVAVLAGSYLVTTLGDLDQSTGDGFIGDSALAMARTFFVLLPYAALAFMIALLTRSSAAGIGLGLAVFFVEGQIVALIAAAGGTAEDIASLFLSRNVTAVLAASGVEGTNEELFSAWRGAAVVAIYTAVFVAISAWRFRTRDISVG